MGALPPCGGFVLHCRLAVIVVVAVVVLAAAAEVGGVPAVSVVLVCKGVVSLPQSQNPPLASGSG